MWVTENRRPTYLYLWVQGYGKYFNCISYMQTLLLDTFGSVRNITNQNDRLGDFFLKTLITKFKVNYRTLNS